MSKNMREVPSFAEMRHLKSLKRHLGKLNEAFISLGEDNPIRFVFLLNHLPYEKIVATIKAVLDGDVKVLKGFLDEAEKVATVNPRCPYETFKRNLLRQQELQSKTSKTDAELQELESIIAWSAQLWKGPFENRKVTERE